MSKSSIGQRGGKCSSGKCSQDNTSENVLLKLQSSFKIYNHYTLSPPFFQHGKTPTGCHSFDDHLPSNQDGGKSRNVVNLGAIRQGMKRFQFLLNCCEPGTIPDASILAAALDLVSCCKNFLTLYSVPVNSANGGKHESLILTLTMDLCFGLIFSPQHQWGKEGKGGEVKEEKK